MQCVRLSGNAVWVGLILAMWVLAGCGARGEVKPVAEPPMWFNPQMKEVCHVKSLLVTTELPEAFLKDKSKVTLLVRMRTFIYSPRTTTPEPDWSAFNPVVKINDKVSYYLRPEPHTETQIKSIEIDKAYLQPGMNSITVTSNMDGMCISPCCPMGIGFSFEDDPRIPFI